MVHPGSARYSRGAGLGLLLFLVGVAGFGRVKLVVGRVRFNQLRVGYRQG